MVLVAKTYKINLFR